MNAITSHPAVEPDFSHLDTAEDIYRDAVKWGLDEELRALLCPHHASDRDRADAIRLAREIANELAGATNRNLAVDVFIYVTGLGDFESLSTRDYARKHGCSCERFRREAAEMRRRFDLPRARRPRSPARQVEVTNDALVVEPAKRQPRLATIFRLAHGLDVEPDKLLRETAKHCAKLPE
jgi:hypothetical protein